MQILWKRKLHLRFDKASVYVVALIVAVVCNFVGFYFQSVLEIGEIYHINYICRIILFAAEICIVRHRVKQSNLILAFLMAISLIFGTIHGNNYFESFFNIHVSCFVCIAFYSSVCISNSIELKKNHVELMMKVFVSLGVIAVVYAMINQFVPSRFFLQLLGGDAYLSWGYRSLFGQRNIYAIYCVLCTFGATYLYLSKKQRWYLVYILLFGIQVFLTNSRASIVAYVMFISLVFMLSRKSRVAVMICITAAVLSLVYAFNISDKIIGIFLHKTSTGDDSATLRIFMWKDMLAFLSQKNALVFGFGSNSAGDYLMPLYGVGSAHNAYMDALFNGGIVYLSIIFYTLYVSYKRVAHNFDSAYRITMIAALVSYAIHGVFEASGSILESTYFSHIFGILLLLIPLHYKGGEAENTNRTSYYNAHEKAECSLLRKMAL